MNIKYYEKIYTDLLSLFKDVKDLYENLYKSLETKYQYILTDKIKDINR